MGTCCRGGILQSVGRWRLSLDDDDDDEGMLWGKCASDCAIARGFLRRRRPSSGFLHHETAGGFLQRHGQPGFVANDMDNRGFMQHGQRGGFLHHETTRGPLQHRVQQEHNHYRASPSPRENLLVTSFLFPLFSFFFSFPFSSPGSWHTSITTATGQGRDGWMDGWDGIHGVGAVVVLLYNTEDLGFISGSHGNT